MDGTVLQHIVTGRDSPAPVLYEVDGSFVTFMNLFSVDSWRRYTVVSDVSVEVVTDGPATVRLVRPSGEVLDSVESDGVAVIPVVTDHGMVGVEVDGTFVSGCFYTSADPVRTCRMALNVCTHDRVPYVERKVADFLRFSRDACFDVDMFVVDNHGNLPDLPVRVIRNGNLGGSGGFARGLYEIRREGGYTHMVFMDDDTVLDFESVHRMWALCSFLRDENAGCMVGGAMLRSDMPTVVHEKGVSIGMERYGGNLDVSTPGGCAEFDSQDPAVANGWWLCCTPFLGEDDYPAPFFTGYDDLEYGLRHGSAVIHLNGVSVWHDSFETKYDPRRLYYYDVRNYLAMRAMGGNLDAGLLWDVYRHCVVEALCMRTVNAGLVLRALGDFMSMGFLEADQEGLHARLPVVVDCGCDAPLGVESRRSRLLTILTLNGMLLPSRGAVIAPARTRSVSYSYRASRVIHYDAGSGRRFVQDRDLPGTLRILFGMTFGTVRCILSRRGLCRRYSRVSDRVHSEGFWRDRFRSGTL